MYAIIEGDGTAPRAEPVCPSSIISKRCGVVNCGKEDKIDRDGAVPAGADGTVCGGDAPDVAADAHASRGDYTIEAVPPAEKAETLRAVNINTAGADELESLPGIGPVLAQRIVDYRTEHGLFRSAEELTQVEGIGRATVESIQDHIITEDRVE